MRTEHRRGLKPGSQCARVLEILADGSEHSFHELLRAVPCVLHSRVAELRKHGYTIDCRRDGTDYLYTLAASPQPEPEKTAERVPAFAAPPGSGSEDAREQLTLEVAA